MKKFLFSLASIALLATACDKVGNGNENGGNTNVPPTPSITLPASLSGSEYFVIQLGEEEYDAISDKVALNLMPYKIEGTETDGIALYVWSDTYAGYTPSGTNSYGFTSGWVALQVTSAGWSGAGYNITEAGVADRAEDLKKFNDIAKDLNNWYFHFAYRSEQDATSHVGIIGYAGAEYKFVFGDPQGTFNNGSVTNRILPVGGEYKKGEWNEYEIALKDLPLDFSKPCSTANLFAFLSGPTTGTTIDLDAIFYYKK